MSLSSALIAVAILAGLAIVLVIIPALALAGHLSDLERQAEIETAIWRQAQSAEDKDAQC
jgi:hypothetical protein